MKQDQTKTKSSLRQLIEFRLGQVCKKQIQYLMNKAEELKTQNE